MNKITVQSSSRLSSVALTCASSQKIENVSRLSLDISNDLLFTSAIVIYAYYFEEQQLCLKNDCV